MPEADQEFEDACWALGTSENPNARFPDGRPVDETARPSSTVLTAADLAEDDPAESPVETTAEDLIPAIPVVPEPAVATTSAPAPVTNPLTATRAELDSLRADLQSERFRFQDERARLEAQLAAARAGGNDLLDGPSEVLDLRREVDDLRGELSQSNAKHLDEIARLQADLKATQAREAQTVIAAQLAEDELKALRSDDSLEVTSRKLAASRAEADALRQVVEELQAREAEREADRRRLEQLEAQLADRENDLRISRESAADRIRNIETQLAAKEAELAVTQQELLDAEVRRAEEAASFLAALHN